MLRTVRRLNAACHQKDLTTSRRYGSGEVSATWVVEDTFKDVGEVKFKINIYYKHFISCLLPGVVSRGFCYVKFPSQLPYPACRSYVLQLWAYLGALGVPRVLLNALPL